MMRKKKLPILAKPRKVFVVESPMFGLTPPLFGWFNTHSTRVWTQGGEAMNHPR